MAKDAPITCPSCATRNRVAVTASGKPRCGKCHADLPWVADATTETLPAVLASSSLPVILDLWAPWCGPCRVIAPALERLAEERAGAIRVVKVNVDNEPAVSADLGVKGIPTLVLFDDGAEVSRQVGALPAARIEQWIDQALATGGR